MKGISNPILPRLRKVTQVLQVSAAPQPGHCPDPHCGGGGMGRHAGDRCSELLLLQDAMCLPKAMSLCWTTATLMLAQAPGGGVYSRTGMLVVCLPHLWPAGLTTSRR